LFCSKISAPVLVFRHSHTWALPITSAGSASKPALSSPLPGTGWPFSKNTCHSSLSCTPATLRLRLLFRGLSPLFHPELRHFPSSIFWSLRGPGQFSRRCSQTTRPICPPRRVL